jgi:ubiquinone/menaquinone biosynthesis C-methylase UbiE
MDKQKSATTQLDFTPAAPSLRTYDFLVAVLTRENTWRGLLLREMHVRTEDRIADIGCGTASLIARICRTVSPEKIIGIDPDAAILEMAKAKTRDLPQPIEFRLGYAREAHEHLQGLDINKIVSSLVFHQVPLEEKRKGLESMYRALVPGGQLFIADYGLQRTRLMRKLFRIVQHGDGFENTQPNADGILPTLMQEAGFSDVQEKHVIATPSGSFSIYCAQRRV